MKKIKRFVLLVFPVAFFTACGTGEETKENEDTMEEEVVMNTDVAESEPTNSSAETVMMTDVESWQIDQYAPFLLDQDPILKMGETTDEQAQNSLWAYEELDVKGGYAKLAGMAMEGFGAMGLWRMKSGDDLVILMTAGCGPACFYEFEFYQGVNEEVVEISAGEVVPVADLEEHANTLLPQILAEYPVDYPEDHQLIYNIPTSGTGMTVDLLVGADELTVPLAKLSWDKEKFAITEKMSDISGL